jgi:hypothetical protein
MKSLQPYRPLAAAPTNPPANTSSRLLDAVVEVGLIWGGIYVAGLPSRPQRITGMVVLGVTQTIWTLMR